MSCFAKISNGSTTRVAPQPFDLTFEMRAKPQGPRDRSWRWRCGGTSRLPGAASQEPPNGPSRDIAKLPCEPLHVPGLAVHAAKVNWTACAVPLQPADHVRHRRDIRREVARSAGDPGNERGASRTGARTTKAPGPIATQAVALGHRRLAVVDLSPAGHQPMNSTEGRFILNFNGEIYNFEALREELERAGQVPSSGWRGHSDTEVLLQAISAWGLSGHSARPSACSHSRCGIAGRVLTLVRDRFGEKPLYYGWAGKGLRVRLRAQGPASAPELRQSPSVARRWLVRHAQLRAGDRSRSIERISSSRRAALGDRREWRGVPRAQPVRNSRRRRRPPQSILVLSRRRGARPRRTGRDEAEAVDLSTGIETSVRGQSSPTCRSAPSCPAESTARQSSRNLPAAFAPRPVRTFSIGFEEAASTKPSMQRRWARHFGTVHHEHYVTRPKRRTSFRSSRDLRRALRRLLPDPHISR